MWTGLNNLCVLLTGFYCNFARVYKSRIPPLRFAAGCFLLGVGGTHPREAPTVGELVHLAVLCTTFPECPKTSFHNLDLPEHSGPVD